MPAFVFRFGYESRVVSWSGAAPLGWRESATGLAAIRQIAAGARPFRRIFLARDVLWTRSTRRLEMRHLATLTLTALALLPGFAAAEESPTPPPDEPTAEAVLVAPRLLDAEPTGVFGARRPTAEPTEQPTLGRVRVVASPAGDEEAETAREPRLVSYTDEQLQLARDVRLVYALGAGAGIVGIAPFLVAFLYESAPWAFVASALWTTEPVQMLVADLLMARARGRGPSAANVAGWVMLGLTVALGVAGGAFELAEVAEDSAVGLAVAGAILFFPMQILTDVLGTRAVVRAGRMLRQRSID